MIPPTTQAPAPLHRGFRFTRSDHRVKLVGMLIVILHDPQQVLPIPTCPELPQRHYERLADLDEFTADVRERPRQFVKLWGRLIPAISGQRQTAA
jgi:hypothetical protein